MSAPVVTDKWAGNFDCDVCRRKRLMAEEFSKKALERYRKAGGPLKCKVCVQKAEDDERLLAASKRASATSSSESRICTICKKDVEYGSYNKNQWSKGEGKSKCRLCVEQALADDASQQKASQEGKLAEARRQVRLATESGNQQAILKAESVLAALEAEKVTGLKPLPMGRGRGRFGRGGRGSLTSR